MLAFESFGACQVPLVVKNPAARTGDTNGGFDPRVGKIPWRRKWQPTAVFLAWRIPWTEETGGVTQSWTQVRDGALVFNLETEPSEQADAVLHFGAR